MHQKDIYLISLETGGNQAYIFSTNKLRNVVGASELIYRAGTAYVERAIKESTGRVFDVAKILDEKTIESTDEANIEVVIATSGKALLLARGEETARTFIHAWSRMIAAEAPGVDAVAVYSKNPVDLSLPLGDARAHSFSRVFEETSKQLSLARMKRPSPFARFQRIPIIAPCQFSGLPATEMQEDHPVSAPAYAQRATSRDDDFKRRMKALYPDGYDTVISEKQNGLESLEDKDWIAVIHADGNGLGQIFIGFEDRVKALHEKATGRDYIKDYRKFSTALDEISQKAFKETVSDIWSTPKENEIIPVVPIVVGGDDLTVVIDGYFALVFANKFMEIFCKETETHEAIKPILHAPDHDVISRLGMCAGVSITKAHFPFSQSYHLAEELMANAKEVKKHFGPDSIALDFHILYDSIGSTIKEIRKKLTIDTRRLTAKPYVVAKGQKESTENNKNEWVGIHDYDKFLRALAALDRGDNKDEANTLPYSQAHSVRESLFTEEMQTQEAEWAFLINTYKKFNEKWTSVSGKDSLYMTITQINTDQQNAADPITHYTYFLDALEAAKFMEGGKSN